MLKYAFVFSFLSPLKSFDDDLCHRDIKTPVLALYAITRAFVDFFL